jgi:hypothetical protein
MGQVNIKKSADKLIELTAQSTKKAIDLLALMEENEAKRKAELEDLKGDWSGAFEGDR